jgi:hypothetical protein
MREILEEIREELWESRGIYPGIKSVITFLDLVGKGFIKETEGKKGDNFKFESNKPEDFPEDFKEYEKSKKDGEKLWNKLKRRGESNAFKDFFDFLNDNKKLKQISRGQKEHLTVWRRNCWKIHISYLSISHHPKVSKAAFGLRFSILQLTFSR